MSTGVHGTSYITAAIPKTELEQQQQYTKQTGQRIADITRWQQTCPGQTTRVSLHMTASWYPPRGFHEMASLLFSRECL